MMLADAVQAADTLLQLVRMQGRSNITRWRQNWKLRPSEPISEQTSTWQPSSSSAKAAAARSRSTRESPSWNTGAW